MYELSSSFHDLTPLYIRSRIKEEILFRYYVGVCPIDGPSSFRSPFRKDKQPTCTFAFMRGRWLYRDWAENEQRDIFDIVQLKYNCSFPEALERICEDFDLRSKKPKYRIKQEDRKVRKKIPKFKVDVQPFTGTDMQYLHRHNITTDIAKKFDAFSIRNLYINGRLVYGYTSYNPAIGYYFGREFNTELWKIYFYCNFRKGSPRFITNTNKINGWQQLPDQGNLLVITKSMKDVMTLDSFNITSIAPQGESIPIPGNELRELKLRFDTLVSLFDFDSAGIAGAKDLRKRAGIRPFFLTNGRFGTKNYKAKDISDYMRDFGLNSTRNLINHGLTKILSHERSEKLYSSDSDSPLSASL